MQYTISFFEPSRWQEYKQIRLEALQQDPIAFGSSYEEEAARPDEELRKILQRNYDAGDSILFAEDQGMVIGMMRVQFEGHQKTRHVSHLHGVYVKPNYRGQGVGKALLTAVLAYLEKKPEIIKLKLGVNSKQAAAKALYTSMGFRRVGVEEKETCVDGEFQDMELMEKLIR